MAWKWYDSKVIKIENQSPNTKRFWIEVPDEEAIQFKAGQFITMDLPIHEKRLKRWRSYSIANEPDQSNILELCIVNLEGGLASKYLFEEVELGTNIRFKGPSGGFVLKEPVDKDLVLICTGTGVAPFRSMLLDIYKNKKAHQNIHLIFGARTEAAILYRKEFEDLQKKMPQFSYDIALSRSESWEGYKGHVHQIYLEKHKDTRTDIQFYLCGWSDMIDDAVANLMIKLGYDKSQIHYELYG